MMSWTVRSEELRDVFPDLETTAMLAGDEVNANWMSRLVRVCAAGDRYYVKTYASRGRGLRRWLGRSRVRAEWENQLLFEQLAVPTAPVVAYGETWMSGKYRGVIVTRELAGTRDLASLAAEGHACLADWYWRRKVLGQLADAVRRLHLNGFVHNDLKWRNILVASRPDAEIYIIDCPMGRYLPGPLLKRGVVKDLACLDKVGRQALNRPDRLRFYLAYRQKRKLARADVREIDKISHFFDGRE
ncbi:MAG: lipopolysaccharide kinase InaA family protein [Pseudomonadales bacterium]